MSIRVVCPNCSKGIKADNKYAGKNAKCPACGAKMKVPIPEAALAPEVVARARPFLIPNDVPTLPPKEQDLLFSRPKFFRNEPVGITLLFVLGMVAAVIAGSSGMRWVWCIPAIAVAALVIKFLKCLTTSLTVTTKRSILRLGILSKRTREVRHTDVRLLQVDQSFFQRMMGVGSISLASAGHGEVEIMVEGLRNPNHIKETIDGYRS